MTRAELIALLMAVCNDDTPVRGIVYNSVDGGMTTVDDERDEYDFVEPLFVEETGDDFGLQIVFQLQEKEQQS